MHVGGCVGVLTKYCSGDNMFSAQATDYVAIATVDTAWMHERGIVCCKLCLWLSSTD